MPGPSPAMLAKIKQLAAAGVLREIPGATMYGGEPAGPGYSPALTALEPLPGPGPGTGLPPLPSIMDPTGPGFTAVGGPPPGPVRIGGAAPPILGTLVGLGAGALVDTLTGNGGAMQTRLGAALSGTIDTLAEMVPVGGPGVPEPKWGVARQWKVKACNRDGAEWWVYYFKMLDGSMLMYNPMKKEWKTWKPRVPIVLATVKPNMKTMGKAARFIARQFEQIDKAKKRLRKSIKD